MNILSFQSKLFVYQESNLPLIVKSLAIYVPLYKIALVLINLVTTELGINKSELIYLSNKQYLHNSLNEYQLLHNQLFKKHEVNTPEEFEQLYIEGKIEEENTWEDFQRFDNANFYINKIKNPIKELDNN